MYNSIKVKKNIFILWLLVIPLGTYLVYQYAPSRQIEWDSYIPFILLALLITFFPIFIGRTTLFLIQWVSLAVFLNYGILAELILMQLCLIPLVYRMKKGIVDFDRIVYSSFIFFVTSVVCGLLVHALGFNFGTLVTQEVVLFAAIYTIGVFILNQLILYMWDYVTNKKCKFFKADLKWDLAGIAMTLPFGLSLYFLESYVGSSAILLLGVPFLMITILVRLYNNSERVNADLHKAVEFGHELAERMTGNEIVDVFFDRITKMFSIDSAYMVDYMHGQFVVLRALEDGEAKELHFANEDFLSSLVDLAYETGEPNLYNKQKEWIARKPPFLSLEMQSVMSVPIYRNKKIEGVLIVASRKKHHFEAYQLKIVHLLSSYFAVSIEKAKYVREAVAKSERCELTQLYNYNYLVGQLESDMERLALRQYSSLSLILLDIDKFKHVNDTYGHHSGNLILKEFATVIQNEMGPNGTVARYGGEEFVILLPNYTKTEALNIAEQLRAKIERTPFIVQQDLAARTIEEIIFITVSLGVSTAPEDSEEGMDLLRNADRALYIGAKQAGRNRVAEYVK